jgi:transcriptional regulator with XRE-family HTH domain
MTQAEVAARVGVQRATITQWESGRHLPAEGRVHDLDRLLRAGGGLITAAEQARPSNWLSPAQSMAVTGSMSGTLLQVLRNTRRAFLDQLQVVNDQSVGWRDNLVLSDEAPSTLATACGLRVLALLGGPDARTPRVIEWVLERAERTDDGRLLGWAARTQTRPRLEATADTLDGLLQAGVPIDVDDVLRMLGDLLDDTAFERPFALATALQPVLRVAPDSDLASRLVKALLECRLEVNGALIWPEKIVQRDLSLLVPSVAHTARAATVLRNAPTGLFGDAVVSAEQWLAGVDDLTGVSEIIRRRVGEDRREELIVHHFTSAWVVRALAGADVPDRRRISQALEYVWARYHEPSHFWSWGNGDVPVWMLADAVAALQEAALALAAAGAPSG